MRKRNQTLEAAPKGTHAPLFTNNALQHPAWVQGLRDIFAAAEQARFASEREQVLREALKQAQSNICVLAGDAANSSLYRRQLAKRWSAEIDAALATSPEQAP
jgi:hypothetical protein